MEAVIAVLRTSDAFAGLWPALAAECGGILRVAEDAAGLAPLASAGGVIVAAGGAEAAAAARLAALRSQTRAPVLVAGALADHRLAISLIRAGAADYVSLPSEMESLRAWVLSRMDAVHAAESARVLTAYEREQYDFSRLRGESEGLRSALARAARVIGHSRATVLITGETGTGKELLAQAIHYNGPRASRPIVEVNCTALPPNLLEAELFGYERGAFTGATSPKPGLFEAADGGTLFLDEIGDLSLELQAKLLRAIETREVRRLGSLRSVAVDVRIIAATNLDLSGAVAARRFREDLFYRLSVVPIHLPPLRERGDDVLVLADAFARELADMYGLTAPVIEDDVRSALLSHPWRGNVRELRNAIERALLLGNGQIRAADLLPHAPNGTTESPLPFPARMDDIERSAARAMVDRFAGNKTAAATALGISRSRLYRLLELEA
ncbi:MAG TPA: sigma 54-interacting transcriptional regulator [Longimicrobiales bacterium]